ncbi:hypothetical protein [Vibrio genomosp. F6]|uniref:hypothetical protein n=1 Tax=Vibrio genomosp. F6 TaxID=723172 RepID=UPI0010BCEED6|nr:hypothetical protein [Vibrio genomosp. F6]TKF22155.1 hypothetical protein FCV43_07905 [Vibrio genomosp. F6]
MTISVNFCRNEWIFGYVQEISLGYQEILTGFDESGCGADELPICNFFSFWGPFGFAARKQKGHRAVAMWS